MDGVVPPTCSSGSGVFEDIDAWEEANVRRDEV